MALADAIVTLPVNPAFASLNLAQAVVIVAYEWFKLQSGGALPFTMPDKSAPAQESAEAALTRARKRAWLIEHGYTVVEVWSADVEIDLAVALNELAQAIGA